MGDEIVDTQLLQHGWLIVNIGRRISNFYKKLNNMYYLITNNKHEYGNRNRNRIQ
jgi:hypothetical protein